MICENCGAFFCADGDRDPNSPGPPKRYCDGRCKKAANERRRHERIKQRREWVSTPIQETPDAPLRVRFCPTGKVRYPDKAEAQKGAIGAVWKHQRTSSSRKLLHAYLCLYCSGWHLTSSRGPSPRRKAR